VTDPGPTLLRPEPSADPQSADPPSADPRGPGRGPSRLLAVAALLFVLAVVAVGTSQLVSETFGGSETRDSTLVAKAPRLTVSAGPGEVVLVPSPDADVHVRTVSRFGVDRPELVEESTAAGVALASDCRSLGSACETSYTVAVPAGFAVTVQRSGSVSAHDLTGPLTVQSTYGDVELTQLSGDITVSTGGDITGTGLRGASITGDTRYGDVTLAFVSAPRHVALGSSSGDVDLGVPAGRSYRVDAASVTGDAGRISIPTDPAADATIRVTTETGDVRVHPA
jgi:hypothetical protein